MGKKNPTTVKRMDKKQTLPSHLASKVAPSEIDDEQLNEEEDADEEMMDENGDEDLQEDGFDEIEDGEDEAAVDEEKEDADEEEDGEEVDDDGDEDLTDADRQLAAEEDAAEAEAAEAEDGEDDEAAAAAQTGDSSKSPHALTLNPDEANDYTAALARRGVIYLSRIPPYMKAAKLRWLLEQIIPKTKKHNRIGRIFLTPEDVSAARRRKKAGGNSGKKFVDGWVEFESKKVAKWLAETYNTQPMGGPKRSRYAEDLWTLKYLKGFKWHHLTEKIAYEKQIRSTKIREEMSLAKKESDIYLEKVEKSNLNEKKNLKRKKDDKDIGSAEPKRHQHQRLFHQRSLIDQPTGSKKK